MQTCVPGHTFPTVRIPTSEYLSLTSFGPTVYNAASCGTVVGLALWDPRLEQPCKYNTSYYSERSTKNFALSGSAPFQVMNMLFVLFSFGGTHHAEVSAVAI